MIKKITPFFSLFILLIISNIVLGDNVDILFTSPINNSKYLRPEETIIISANQPIDASSLSTDIIQVSGKLRNNYPGNIFLSDDKKTIIYKPFDDFLGLDTIQVNINKGIKTLSGDYLNPKQIIFTIRETESDFHYIDSFRDELLQNDNAQTLNFLSSQLIDPLPPNFPGISIINSSNPSYGKLFFSNFDQTAFAGGTGNGGNERGGTTPFLIIHDKDSVYYYKQISRYALDFRKVENGNLVYFLGGNWKYYMIDTNYNVIDSFDCGHGYQTDGHDLRFLDNGHTLMMSYDYVTIDMSKIVSGGDTAAQVTGLVIQELDSYKNVVFQWRSWDHFKITDGLHENLTARKIDYVHGNSIESDYDGNIIISSRHMDEITKINRTTGEIMWRMGGVNNEFTFLNDPRGFTYQHDARRIAPGRITLFDNGNHHSVPYSRAIEYEVDEVNKTVKLVWEYDHNKEIFAFAMGNVQRLPNGNTVIGWGAGYPNITEIDPFGNIQFELATTDSLWTYRAFRFPFKQPENEIPQDFSLNQNFPNPFNPSTTISFQIPTQTNVSLKIYDILGREVAQLINENVIAGQYNITWNAQNFSSGVYFYKIIAGNFVESKKMVLTK